MALATPLLWAAGMAIGSRWLVPVLLALPAWSWMAHSVRAGRPRQALADMLLWAFALAVTTTAGPLLAPERAAELTLNGTAYRDEMWHWLETGEGAEGLPRQFLPLHARDLGLFLLAAVVSGALVAMIFGAALMGYMGFYVASLVSASSWPLLTAVLGWHPWSVLRVIGFVIAGVLLSEWLLARGAFAGLRKRMALAATALILADIGLKAVAAETWRQLLVSMMP